MITVIKKGTPKEEVNKKLNEAIKKTSKTSILKHAGTLTTDIDPIDYQRQLRDEWK